MGFLVSEFEYNNFVYYNTYHRVGILKRDKARKLMTLLVYVYKNKQLRDSDPLNNFLVLRLECNKGNFCKYFDHVNNPNIENLDIEMQCYLYLKKEVSNYKEATPVFEEEQEFLFNEYMAKIQAEEQAKMEEYDDPMDQSPDV